ncbi:MAG TPA: hypothetical protein VFM46_14965 [Pseudomonadales bacterium]|nr:hypothetical protein [Pseudomonadales bacterium]
MSETEILTRFIEQAPGLAAALCIVVLFLRSQSEQNRQWREFLERERLSRDVDTSRVTAILEKLVDGCNQISNQLGEQDVFLKTSLDAMMKAQGKRKRATESNTTPIRRDNGL